MLRPWTLSTLTALALALPLVASAAPAELQPSAAPTEGGLPASFASPVREFHLPHQNSRPSGIVAGPDGALWFTQQARSVIGRITVSGEITEFPLPQSGSGPLSITVGADGALWFTESFADRIGRITTAGVITEWDVPTPDSQPWDITALPDGSLWFTEHIGKVGVIDRFGNIREYSSGSGQSPAGITTGPDGNVWFTEELGNNVVRLVPGDPPTMTEYPLQTAGALPYDITKGPDGNLWFTQLAGRHIGKVTPKGQITEYPVAVDLGVFGIAAGADGRLWFTENDGAKVGSISTNGVMGRRFNVGIYPFGITTGPGDDVWFVSFLGNSVSRVQLFTG